MLSKNQFTALLESNGPLIIDGALATELEARGHNLNHALWSAKLLKDDPASIKGVHLDYYLAGADVAITASYQATTQGIVKHLDMSALDAIDLISRSVHLAHAARDEAYEQGVDSRRTLLVAGSVGPYGAYLSDGSEYRGDYIVSAHDFQAFHRPRIQALVDAGVDLLALETIPSLPEIKALLELLETEFPETIAWLSCTSRDAAHLADGSPWESVLNVVQNHTDQILAFGINCVPLQSVTDTMKQLGRVTGMPLLCYPNSGETWDAQSKTWTRASVYLDSDQQQTGTAELRQEIVSGNAFARLELQELSTWISLGAKLVGGCCRTGPDFIQAMAHQIRNQPDEVS